MHSEVSMRAAEMLHLNVTERDCSIILEYCIVLYCIVLYLWSGHCCPNALRPIQIYCAPPNLGITRTLIRRLNFAQMSIFSGLKFFNEPDISYSESQPKVPSGGLVLRIFTSWKNPLTWVGFEPASFGSRGEHVTPRPPRHLLCVDMCLFSHDWQRPWW